MRATLTLRLLLSCAVLVSFMPPGRILLAFCIAMQMHMDTSQCTSLANYRRARREFGFALYALAGRGAAEFQRPSALPARRQFFEQRVSPLDSRAWAWHEWHPADTRTLSLSLSDFCLCRHARDFPFQSKCMNKAWIPNWVIVSGKFNGNNTRTRSFVLVYPPRTCIFFQNIHRLKLTNISTSYVGRRQLKVTIWDRVWRYVHSWLFEAKRGLLERAS